MIPVVIIPVCIAHDETYKLAILTLQYLDAAVR